MRFGFVAMVLSSSILFSCQKESSNWNENELQVSSSVANSQSEPCGQPQIELLRDYQQSVGTYGGRVTVSNDADNIYVEVCVNPGLTLVQVKGVIGDLDHLNNNNYVWDSGPEFPDFDQSFFSGETCHTFTLSRNDYPADCNLINIWVHYDETGGFMNSGYLNLVSNTSTGTDPVTNYFEYCVRECPPPPPEDCGQLRTQTPGGWGAPPNGNNPGTYLHANFASTFPSGLEVGCYPGNYYVRVTSAQAITDLLPTGGQAKVLTQNYTNPASIKNVLVGHLIALKLSVGFDYSDPSFGEAGMTLGNMIIGSGPFEGWTVQYFLSVAEDVLGGCNTSYTAVQVLETASKINENYVDGLIDLGFLECPTDRSR